MKTRLTIPLLTFLFACLVTSCGDNTPNSPSPEPPEEVFNRQQESLIMNSKILSRNVKYSVLLPEGYDKTKETYSVVYLFHGYGDNELSWLNGGRIRMHADRSVSNGTANPIIFVMPEGFNAYYVNRYNGAYNYMQMLTEELVPLIDKKYRTKPDKQHRATMGYSMGGYGAFILPTVHPELFTTAVSLSMSWRTDKQYIAEPQGVFDSQFGSIFGGSGATGQARITSYFKTMSPFHIFQQADISKYNKLNYFLDCGDDEEQLSITNDELHTLMLNKGIKHEYRMRDGAHNWDYWSVSMDEAFAFLQTSFSAQTYPEESKEVATDPDKLEGSYAEINIDGLKEKGSVYLPADYASSETKYPVIYLLHDKKNLDVRSSIRKVLSLVETAHVVAGLSKTIFVEIPVSAITDDAYFSKVVAFIDQNYRTIQEPTSRLIMANNDGGKFVDKSFPLVNSCFLYNAKIPTEGLQQTLPFYYLDMTDKASFSKEYGELYVALREKKVQHQYRVRNGTESYQSFLNGLSDSFAYMNSYLKK